MKKRYVKKLKLKKEIKENIIAVGYTIIIPTMFILLLYLISIIENLKF